MPNEAVTIESARQFMDDAFAGFVRDPPDSDFQSGYLAALYIIAREGMGMDMGPPPAAVERAPKQAQHLRVVK